MRERRSTVRVPCALPVQYSPTNRFSNFAGRLADVSVRGLGLSTPHPIERGAHLSAKLLLPGEDEPVILTGIVRWSSSTSSKHGDYESGIELTNVDDTTHFCLQSFVTARLTDASSASRFTRQVRRGEIWNAIRASVWAVSGVCSAALIWWIAVSERQKATLREDLAERAVIVGNLQVRQQALQQELGQAQLSAADAVTEIQRLQAERAQLETQLGWMTRSLTDLQDAYARVREERENLRRQIVEMEQRFQSIPELRKAMRTAVKTQRDARRLQRTAWIQRLRAADQDVLQRGNRGYVVQAGASTITGSRVAVRVYAPELSEPSPQ